MFSIIRFLPSHLQGIATFAYDQGSLARFHLTSESIESVNGMKGDCMHRFALTSVSETFDSLLQLDGHSPILNEPLMADRCVSSFPSIVQSNVESNSHLLTEAWCLSIRKAATPDR
jgi:hypothetical protein